MDDFLPEGAPGDKVLTGAEFIFNQAQGVGETCGVRKEIAAIVILEQALATAIAVSSGPRSPDSRLTAFINLMSHRLGKAVQLAYYVRFGRLEKR